jgi:ribA/ribD-fused uncharacterized protein
MIVSEQFRDEWQARVLDAHTGAQAKSVGSEAERRFCPKKDPKTKRPLDNKTKWDSVKEKVMVAVLIAKFSQNADLREYLLSTGDRILVEASREDTYWAAGADEHRVRFLIENNPQWHPDQKVKRPDGTFANNLFDGQNRLGELLMQVRRYLRGNLLEFPSRSLVGDSMIKFSALDGFWVISWPGAKLADVFNLLKFTLLPVTVDVVFHAGTNNLAILKTRGKNKKSKPMLNRLNPNWIMREFTMRFFEFDRVNDKRPPGQKVTFYFSEILRRLDMPSLKNSVPAPGGQISRCQKTCYRVNNEIRQLARKCRYLQVIEHPGFVNPRLFKTVNGGIDLHLSADGLRVLERDFLEALEKKQPVESDDDMEIEQDQVE